MEPYLARRNCIVTLGLKLGFLPDLLRLALKVYQGPRNIVGEEPTVWAGRGLIQGCPLAPAISKLAMFYPMLAVRESGLTQHEDLWIDDVTLDCQSKDPKVAATWVSAHRLLTGRLAEKSLAVRRGRHFRARPLDM